MEEKNVQQLMEELRSRDLKDALLKESDSRYAIKLVEKIVFAMVAVILLAALTALVSLIINKPPQL